MHHQTATEFLTLAQQQRAHIERRRRIAARAVPDRGIHLQNGRPVAPPPPEPAIEPEPEATADPVPEPPTVTETLDPLQKFWLAMADAERLAAPGALTVRAIQEAVASQYGVTRIDILSSRRTDRIVRPRQVAMYLAKTLTLRSLPEIGRMFGGRDHTTVLYAVRKIEAMVKSGDAEIVADIDAIKQTLTTREP